MSIASQLSFSTATSVLAGTAGALLYQSAANTTAFLTIGTNGYVLTSNGSVPGWSLASGITAGNATYIASSDDRTKAPADDNAGALRFGFTSFANNNSSPYADYLHLRSYTDATGGNDNLVMFRKDAIGMRIWQQAWGTTSNYVTYKDVAFTDSSITGAAAQVNTILQTGNATYYPTFVDSNNAAATAETVYTTSSFTINPLTGNVGHGTASPAAALHVVGSESRFGGVASGYISVYNASTRSGYIQANGSTDLRIAADTDPMTFYVNGSERARIDTWGNVAIGKTGPYNTTTDVLTVLRLQNATSRIFVDNQNTNTSAAAAITLSAYGGDTQLSVPASWPTTGLNPLVITVNATERLRITSAGAIAFSGSTNYGNSGDVLKSNGNAAPTWVAPSTVASGSATNADNIKTILQTGNASYYPVFVSANNAVAAYMPEYTTSSFAINASTGLLTSNAHTVNGALNVTSIANVGTGANGDVFSAGGSGANVVINGGSNSGGSIRHQYATGSMGVYGGGQATIGLLVASTGVVTINATTNATTTLTGALIVTGGVGIGRDVWVGGGLYATTKSFVIDHPTRPGMKLRYGSLEGPENGVYVRGKLTDSNKILLPEYWTKLVDPDSITVSLTSIGKHQDLFVADIANNVVTIGNGNILSKAINCFYVVYGERCDVDKLVVEI